MTGGEGLEERARELMKRLEFEAEAGGYHLNPDREFAMDLCKGLVQNIDRYGYMGCPCRLMEGDRLKDLDVICPCDYRDPDLDEYGACYCALYVTRDVLESKRPISSIPERRPASANEIREQAKQRRTDPEAAGIHAWRCRVCGYLCAREKPPDECPVCHARKDRFERFSRQGS